MKKHKINTFDLLIERLVANFSEVKDFEKLQESEEGKRLFDLLVKSVSEMESYRSLFLEYYIPASNKSIHDSWNLLHNSRYKSLINITKEDLKDNLYETIRLGYIGLFHKYESYLKSAVSTVDFFLKELNNECNLLTIDDYCKKEFKFSIYRTHDKFAITSKLNYISNCVKHYDGFPVKEPIHKDFIFANVKEKIKLEKETFKTDIDRLKIHSENLLTQLIFIGFKQFMDSECKIDENDLSPDMIANVQLRQKLIDSNKNFDIILEEFIK
jgi:hypothetical protein